MALTADEWADGRPITLVSDAFAVGVDTDSSGRARGVTWCQGSTGDLLSEEATVVVMAAGAIETPRLWLNSGLPNTNDWVGRGLADHTLDLVIGVMPESIGATVGPSSAARADFPGFGIIENFIMSPAFGAQALMASDGGIAGWYDNGSAVGTAGADSSWHGVSGCRRLPRMSTGLVFHERYLWHDTGNGWVVPNDGVVLQPYEHPENPETKRRMLNLWRACGMLDQLVEIAPRSATVDEVLRVHGRDYHDRIRDLSATGGGDAGGLTPFGLGSYEIALLAAGGCIAAVDAVLDGVVDNVYALVRPPGHHAIPDSGMGFCLFNNAAIAVKHLRETRSVARVAMVDWDVHHGNGQQTVFYEDPSVLTISLHQDLCFPPESGYIADNGAGPGEGYNINIPLPPGSGHGAYLAAYERVAVEALRRFRPDFIVAPSGFDGGATDPLGRMMAWSETFRLMTRMLKAAADELCGGRLVFTHEGGYAAPYVPFLGLAVMEELTGWESGVIDPLGFFTGNLGGQDLQPHQDAIIAESQKLLGRIVPPS